MSPIPVSRRASQTPPSPIRKLAPLARSAKERGASVYHLNIGQPDIETPREFFDGLAQYKEKIVAYDISEGNQSLRSAWSSYIKRLNNLDIPAENFLITTGASEALIFVFMLCCDPGDEVIIFDPTYANYIGFAAISGVNLVPIETSLDQNFAMPEADLIHSRITPRTKAILLCNPNNPTGTVYSKAELQRLLEICNERNIFLVVDETYREFVYDGLEPLSVFHLAQKNERVIVVDSLSKRFSLCGARIGCIMTANQEILKKGLNLAQARLASPSIEQVACAYMLDNISDNYLNNMVSEYQRRRDTLFNSLAKLPDVVAQKPSGAFYCVVRLPVPDAADFARFMLEEFTHEKQTVFVAPANGFYMSYQGGLNKIRIAYVLNSESMQRAAEILGLGLQSYLKR